MSEYPKEIMDAAVRLVNAFHDARSGRKDPYIEACKELMAERNRCAAIAKRHDTGDNTREDMEARRIWAEITDGDA